MNFNNRFDELDSVRGLAATSVLLKHIFGVTPIFLVGFFSNTPFHIFWAGQEAVILFFILSGFVLSLPYHSQRSSTYSVFLVRRIFRIYLPYLISIALAIVCLMVIPRIHTTNLYGWVTISYPITFKEIVKHIVFLGTFQSASYNFVIWSLVHEMRISILFPFLMLLVRRFGWKKILCFCLIDSVFCLILWEVTKKLFNLDLIKLDTSFLWSLHYIGLFMVGALLAKYRESLGLIYKKLNTFQKFIALIVSILAYTYNWWALPNLFILHLPFINDWVVVLGCSIFIVFALNSNKVKAILLFKPIHFVGRTSYSLYLFHIPLLLSLINALYGKLPIGLILILAVLLSYILGGLMYYLVERPSIKLGRILIRSKLSFQNRAISKHI